MVSLENVSSKRKNILKILLMSIIIVVALTFSTGIIYYKNSLVKYANYSETATLKYRVNLNNQGVTHYQEYLNGKTYLEGSDEMQYLVNYIDNLALNFTYALKIDKPDLNYSYEYSIEKRFVITNKQNGKVYVESSEYLQEPITKSAQGGLLYMFNESAEINYQENVNKVAEFVTSLLNYEANVEVSLNVKIKSRSGQLVKDIDENTAIKVTIPLVLNSSNTDIRVSKVVTNEDGLVACIPEANSKNGMKIITIILAIISIVIIIIAVTYWLISRTIYDVYTTKLNKIIKNYGSYLTKINGVLEFGDKKVLKVEKFVSLVEIRDTIQQPILYTIDEVSCCSRFAIYTAEMVFLFDMSIRDFQKTSEYTAKYAIIKEDSSCESMKNVLQNEPIENKDQTNQTEFVDKENTEQENKTKKLKNEIEKDKE